jgi:hypothetical protein
MFVSRFHRMLIAACAVGVVAALGTGDASAQSAAAYCDSVARNHASQHAHGGEVLGSAVGGAVTGAIIGGIVGGKRGAGTGAAIGGGVGAVGGAANQSNRWNALYHQAFNECMAHSHSAPPVHYSEGPEPWTPEWYAYCGAKYRSFNPATGLFLAYSGEYKMCR